MPLTAVIGQAHALDIHQGITNAANQALYRLGRKTVSLGIVILPAIEGLAQVLSELSAILGDVPLFGFSTPAAFVDQNHNQHAFIVALICGEEISASASWWEIADQENPALASRIIETFQIAPDEQGGLLLAGNADFVDAQNFCTELASLTHLQAGGCLLGNSSRQASSYLIGGKQGGKFGLAAAVLRGQIAVGTGSAHGWTPLGLYSKVTQAQGRRLLKLDGRSPNELYSEWFGQAPNAWKQPPLNEIVRLYPLGLEGTGKDLQVCAPLHMEADGSLLMVPAVPEGSIVHWMIGNGDQCLKAAEDASRQALQGLNGAKPVMGLIFADLAYHKLMETQPGSLMKAVRQVTGDGFPLAGGYTLGQIARINSKDEQQRGINLYNQHIVLMLFGDNS